MSLLARSRKVTGLARNFSTESPKVSVARGLLRLAQIQGAKDENELKKVLASPLPTVDFKNLPAEFEPLGSYFAGSSVSASTGFKPDPTSWQNQDFFSFAAAEGQRSETWPFVVGFVIVNVFLAGGIAASLPEEARKNSKYAQLLDAKRGITHGDNHAHAHH